MKKILISTIIRNRSKFLNMWLTQLKNICLLKPEIHFYLSVYENDSHDNSRDLLKTFDYSGFKEVSILCENLNTPSFGSVKDELRVKLLAHARNKSIYENKFLNDCDYVISVEPDIEYDPKSILKIIENDNYDILSARSIEYIPPDPNHLYDGWGTRNTQHHSDWEHSVNFSEIINVWTTYNCFCKYKADPIKNKITYGWYNERFKVSDCDTAVICENFRNNGYTKIALDGSVNVLHRR